MAAMPLPMLRHFRVDELRRLFQSRYRGAPLPEDDAGWDDIENMLLASLKQSGANRR
jgi:hypothetical protein